MKTETIHPVKAVSGPLELPGDKSISHRYAMLAALADGTSELRNFAAAHDCHSTLGCMKALGAEVKVEGTNVKITGHGLRGLKSTWRSLDAENSGTTIRLLSGILSGQEFTTRISGDASLQKRPMKRVVAPLRQMGADIRAQDNNFPPLEIHGGKLIAIHGLVANNGKAALQPKSLNVPGDISSAVFFVAAASLLPESNVYIANVGLNPTRSAILDFFQQMGASVTVLNLQSMQSELIGDLAVKGAQLKGGVIAGDLVPLLIDELPMLAALGPYTEQGIEIRDAGELRVKESDRIAALAENLKRMGAKVEERPDGLRVEGRSAGKLHGAEINPRGDHRIAMAFAVAGLAAQGETKILDAECAGVSYPSFFSELLRLSGE